jgi:hypothetical protein
VVRVAARAARGRGEFTGINIYPTGAAEFSPRYFPDIRARIRYFAARPVMRSSARCRR